MLDSVYNAKILEYAGNIERVGELKTFDAKARAHSKLCGSTVDVWLKMEDDSVSEFSHKVKACALGQAASSIMARPIRSLILPPGLKRSIFIQTSMSSRKR